MHFPLSPDDRHSSRSPRALVTAGIIAALYAALTALFLPISYGPVQFRFSEALTILPLFTPYAAPGLFVGCALANLIGGYGVWDVVVGSLTTLLAALCTRALRGKPWLAMIPPVLFNAVAIGLLLYFLTAPGSEWTVAWSFICTVGIGQLISVYAAGGLLFLALRKAPGRIFRDR